MGICPQDPVGKFKNGEIGVTPTTKFSQLQRIRRLRTTNYELRTTNFILRTSDYRLTSDSRLTECTALLISMISDASFSIALPTTITSAPALQLR